MISSQSIFGALAAIFGIALMIDAAVGIHRRQLNSYGQGAGLRGHHDHRAVRQELFQLSVGLTSLLCGIYILLSWAVA